MGFDLSIDIKKAISHRQGLSGDWELLSHQGQMSTVFRVGDAVVKIPGDDPECLVDMRTEVVALRALTDFPTPQLVAFDDQLDLLDRPYLVLEYFDGRPLTADDPVDLQELGGLIAKLHGAVDSVPDPDGWLDRPVLERSFRELKGAFRAGKIDRTGVWALGLYLVCLRPFIHWQKDRVFLHNDIHPGNILVNENGEMVLNDWGDAGWGDPAIDFSAMPPDWLKEVTDYYESELHFTVPMRFRVMWNQIGEALRHMQEPGSKGERGLARLKEFQACEFFNMTP